MRTTRLYVPQALQEGSTVIAGGQAAHHARNVLRLRAGATLRVFDGNGREHAATLLETGRTEITLAIAGRVAATAEPALHIRLVQGIARNDRMDLVLQKAVELGVETIQPVWMQRSQGQLGGERLARRVQHWRGVVIGACEQCGRATLPQLAVPLDYGSWADSHRGDDLRIMLQPEGAQSLNDLEPAHAGFTLLVGPEGGLSPGERQIAAATGFTGVRLGQRVLRTETAGLAALAAIQVLWGDFR